MTEYKPPARVMALAAQVKGVPIAHALLPDGCIVIVFEDGRKLTFAPATPVAGVDDGGFKPPRPTARPSKPGKGK